MLQPGATMNQPQQQLPHATSTSIMSSFARSPLSASQDGPSYADHHHYHRQDVRHDNLISLHLVLFVASAAAMKTCFCIIVCRNKTLCFDIIIYDASEIVYCVMRSTRFGYCRYTHATNTLFYHCHFYLCSEAAPF
jgi:hypothetical protein